MVDEGYTTPMDRNFTPNVHQIGASTNPFQHQTEALKARIFHGASRVEFSFFGQGKTNKEQPGPESFGVRERQDMRELAIINKVQTSTHATVGIQGLSGFDGKGSFSSEQQKNSLDELRKAIDFASEATTGGAVVFHTGDGPRSMYSNFKGQFMQHHNEKEEEIHYLVDPEDKKIIGAVAEDTYIVEPVHQIETDANGKPILDSRGNTINKYLKDENGNNIKDELTGNLIPVFKQTTQDDIQTERYTFSQWKEKEKNIARQRGEYVPDDKELVKKFFVKQQELNIQYSLGQSRQFIDNYNSGLKDRDKIIDALKYYKGLKNKLPPEEWEKNFVKSEGMKRGYDQYTIPDQVDPVKYLQDALKDNMRTIGYGKEVALSGIRQATDLYAKVKKAEMLQDFSQRKSTEAIAEAAIYAYEKTQDQIKKDNAKYSKYSSNYVSELAKNPLYVSPESWRPEDYGGHPDEMRQLVQKSREKVFEKLKNTHGEVKARQIANQSIKATLDIGHLNSWKRFFVRNKNEEQDHFDNRFKTWVLDESRKLAKDGIIGHVHLSDNFGYHDEHMTVGDGNAPIKEFVEIMRKHGVKEFIVEAGSHNPLTAMPDAWSHLGSPIYRVGAPSGGSSLDAWGEVHQGYFGSTEGPRYVVGEYAPSEDFRGSPFYTGAPLE